MSDKNPDEVKEKNEYQTIAEFLESTPPNRVIKISNLSTWRNAPHYENVMNTPEVQLHCPHEKCSGVRFFRCESGYHRLMAKDYKFFYARYRCSNCLYQTKIFSLAAEIDSDREPQGSCFKLGELPLFGPLTSPKLITLIGPDRDEFLKGRRCENQGLGVGAFTYYRRVVENQKTRILEKIIRVSEKIGAPEDKIEKLKSALSETHFSKSLDMAKDVIPESLLINGHSPILLLHSALSKGVHELTDGECLEIAGNIRVVIGELSEKLSQSLKDNAEIKKALSSLMNMG